MLAQKSATQFADGEGALAMWKNSITEYHDDHKVTPLIFINEYQFLISCSPSTESAVIGRLQHALGCLGPRFRQMR